MIYSSLEVGRFLGDQQMFWPFLMAFHQSGYSTVEIMFQTGKVWRPFEKLAMGVISHFQQKGFFLDNVQDIVIPAVSREFLERWFKGKGYRALEFRFILGLVPDSKTFNSNPGTDVFFTPALALMIPGL
ncbi:hypothetical protein CEXT_657361 [Caerostris extrusa]|uniref:Uncharacterized protein n=1 Tax=Caerostris extrusa TaxID=172846 RepID=A0AAV4V0X7_CAEEX|nr:hypothetical protein CEXT_657361 [Caerostris extrusa]